MLANNIDQKDCNNQTYCNITLPAKEEGSRDTLAVAMQPVAVGTALCTQPKSHQLEGKFIRLTKREIYRPCEPAVSCVQ